jgi:cob(I)alamin adenosyltransferase
LRTSARLLLPSNFPPAFPCAIALGWSPASNQLKLLIGRQAFIEPINLLREKNESHHIRRHEKHQAENNGKLDLGHYADAVARVLWTSDSLTNGIPIHEPPRTGTIKGLTPMPDIRRGLIIVNTGPGKGKTTAAMGTALRAVGQGMQVLMLQFLKGSWHYGELDAVQAFGDKFVMKQMGRGFVKVGTEKPDPEDVRMVEEAWNEAEQAIQSGQWDLVILDEINYAISYGMLDPAKVVASLQRKPDMVHVILTGRNAHPTIVELADTVTEMRQVKHAYEKGVLAQRGIEY